MDEQTDRAPWRYLAIIFPLCVLWILASSALQALRQLSAGLLDAERASI